MKKLILTSLLLLSLNFIFSQTTGEEVLKDSLCSDLKMGIYQTSHNHPSADKMLMNRAQELVLDFIRSTYDESMRLFGTVPKEKSEKDK